MAGRNRQGNLVILEIKEVKEEDQAIKNFTEKEWVTSDFEHYGKQVKWEKKQYN
ncbi:hypothetical protein KKA27_03315 [Patescibacteria group bacterium]|nr:hypothetical protein [Patescibacteria group bacterium]MBU2633247.1 hypothetical protein [Patescibacteria group bacterium]